MIINVLNLLELKLFLFGFKLKAEISVILTLSLRIKTMYPVGNSYYSQDEQHNPEKDTIHFWHICYKIPFSLCYTCITPENQMR